MSLNVNALQTGQQVHIIISADDMPGNIAEFDTNVAGFERLAFELLNARIQVTHVDPEPELRGLDLIEAIRRKCPTDTDVED